MNLLLLDNPDFIDDQQIRISDERFTHLIEIKKVAVGDKVTAGKINGKMGLVTIQHIASDYLIATCNFNQNPPQPLPVTVVMALPRPKMLRRIFHMLGELGIKELHLINSYKVEKSYWQSPALTSEGIQQHLKLGIAQAIDTQLPSVHLHKTFKPFIEDIFPDLSKNKRKILGIPEGTEACPKNLNEETILVIGPEGGFTDYENSRLLEAGCEGVSLGSRILRVETALPVLTARLFF